MVTQFQIARRLGWRKLAGPAYNDSSSNDKAQQLPYNSNFPLPSHINLLDALSISANIHPHALHSLQHHNPTRSLEPQPPQHLPLPPTHGSLSFHAQHPISRSALWFKLKQHGRQHELPCPKDRGRVASYPFARYIPNLPAPPLHLQLLISLEQFRILRKKGTEMAGTGKYDKHYPSSGTYNCAACSAPLYRANHKFDSGCGWPAFWDAVPDAVGQRPDPSLGMMRTEIVCNNCGGHLGHIFKGEKFGNPKDDRHCVNSVSIDFSAGDKNESK